jgi:hypothetical protein
MESCLCVVSMYQCLVFQFALFLLKKNLLCDLSLSEIVNLFE